MKKKPKKRIKPSKPSILQIAGWPEADVFIKNIAKSLGKIDSEEKKATEEIRKIKARLTAAITPSNEAIKQYTRSLEAFCKEHKSEIKLRSRKLNFGVVGWRRSTSISITEKTIGLIQKLMSNSQVEALLRSKVTVDKEALGKLPASKLAKLDAKKKVKDVFFVEPDLTKGAKY